jgi:hypothetical protein
MSKLWSLMALLGLLGALGGCRPIQAPLPSTVAGLPIEGGDLPPQPVAGAADPFAQNRRLGRGINLGNALEAPTEGEWGVTLQAEYFLLIRQRGFDSVRIPVRWSSHAAATPPFTIEPRFLARVEWAVDQALKNDLLVVLNVHQTMNCTSRPMRTANASWRCGDRSPSTSAAMTIVCSSSC